MWGPVVREAAPIPPSPAAEPHLKPPQRKPGLALEMLEELGQALGMLVAAVGNALCKPCLPLSSPGPGVPGLQPGHGR